MTKLIAKHALAKKSVNFVRVYSFYVRKNKPTQAYFFSVTVSANKKLNPMTGMSVDLVQLDKVAKKILDGFKVSAKTGVVEDLQRIELLFKKLLAKIDTKLVRVQFDETRGSSYLFQDGKTYFIRRDLATDDNGDLSEVASYFDSRNKLVRMDLRGFKDGIKETLVF